MHDFTFFVPISSTGHIIDSLILLYLLPPHPFPLGLAHGLVLGHSLRRWQLSSGHTKSYFFKDQLLIWENSHQPEVTGPQMKVASIYCFFSSFLF